MSDMPTDDNHAAAHGMPPLDPLHPCAFRLSHVLVASLAAFCAEDLAATINLHVATPIGADTNLESKGTDRAIREPRTDLSHLSHLIGSLFLGCVSHSLKGLSPM
jgi:hypothetical protein